MNKKITFLLTHPPDPRISNRIQLISRAYSDISLIYWNRFKETGVLPKKIKTIKLNLPDPHSFLKRVMVSSELLIVSYKYLSKEKPNILYIGGIDMLIVGWLYKILHKSIKIIYEVADMPGGRFARKTIAKWLINITNRLFKKIDLLILTSPFYWEKYYQYIFPYKNKVLILENFPKKTIFKNFKPIGHKKLTIGFVGFVRYPKQLINLFEACQGLNDVKIIIAGRGPDYDYVKKVSQNYTNVSITGPFNYEKDILSIYSKIDLIYCVYDTSLTNVNVAIPNKLYEAIVSSIPIIVARGTKLAELVKKYKIGFEVSDNIFEETRRLIINILNNPNMLEERKRNADKIKEKFYFENKEKEILNKIKKC